MKKTASVIPIERITHDIFMIRGLRVMIDADLANNHAGNSMAMVQLYLAAQDLGQRLGEQLGRDEAKRGGPAADGAVAQ